MSNLELNTELMSLKPYSIVELFIIDTTNLDENRLPPSEQIIRVANHNSSDLSAIYFNGVKYTPAPCEFENNELKGDGTQLPRPNFRITNHMGYASTILRQTKNLIGAKFTRRRVFVKFLDAESWSSTPPLWNQPNIESYLSEDIFYVNKKSLENKDLVEIELATDLEMEGIRLPRRPMFANSCAFEYRNSKGCQYSGPPAADSANKKFEVAVISGGYGLTLSNAGEWNESTTYNEGDYVYIQSSEKYNELQTQLKRYYFVCLNNGVSGYLSRPTLDKNNWVADACSRKTTGCVCRYNLQNLPIGAWPALSQVGFQK